MLSFCGYIITSDPNALKDTTERLFPTSRHRSARVLKKLIKRHGGEFRKEPCAWEFGGRIVAHPNIYAEIRESMKVSERHDPTNWNPLR